MSEFFSFSFIQHIDITKVCPVAWLCNRDIKILLDFNLLVRVDLILMADKYRLSKGKKMWFKDCDDEIQICYYI